MFTDYLSREVNALSLLNWNLSVPVFFFISYKYIFLSFATLTFKCVDKYRRFHHIFNFIGIVISNLDLPVHVSKVIIFAQSVLYRLNGGDKEGKSIKKA